MKFKVIKTYDSNKVALCVAIVENEFVTIESKPAYLTIKQPVVNQQVIDMGELKAVIVERQGVNSDKTPMLDSNNQPCIFRYWEIEA